MVTSGWLGGLMEDAFDNHSGARRWRQAAQAIGLHRAAGRQEEADSLQRRVLAESGLEGVTAQAASGFLDSADALAAIETACNNSLINLFGGDACLASIDSAVTSAVTHSDVRQQRGFAEAVVTGVRRAVNSPRLLAEQVVFDGMYDEAFEAVLAAGVESTIVYVAYSQRLEDRARALELVERALALDPDDGELWLRRGMAQVQLGRADDAIESLNQARSILPATRDFVIDLHMQRAEDIRTAGR